jgi:tRNA-dihydrouridine synthase
MKQHLDLSIQHYGERRGVSTFHKFFIWYTRGLTGARPFRDRAFRADSVEDFLEIIEELRTLSYNGIYPGDDRRSPCEERRSIADILL